MTTIPFDLERIKAPRNVRPTLDEINRDVNRYRTSQVDTRCPYSGNIKSKDDVPTPPYAELPKPKDIQTDLNFLATSADLMNLQRQTNEVVDRRRYESSWQGLTIRRAVADVREALLGIPADLFGNSEPAPLRELMTKNDRMRGVGILLAVLAALFMLFSS